MIRRPASVLFTLPLVALAACSMVVGGPGVDRAAAVRAVLAEEDRFTGITERDPDLIGQASWYEAASIADGWQVVVRIGWGDCEAGCISEHRWTYVVAGSQPTLVDETGDPLPAATGVTGMAVAGPTCPVVHDPPDPACDDRPVAGAEIAVLELGGGEVARVVTDASGRFGLELAPGAYRLEPQPVEGLMGTAASLDLRVGAGQPTVAVTLTYDTGIR